MVGFRTRAGVLTTTQSFKTIQIPRLVRGKPGGWDPLLCLDWGHRFLGFLKGTICGGSADAVWRVTFVPGSGISVVELDSSGIREVVNDEDRVGFLPSWYWDELVIRY